MQGREGGREGGHRHGPTSKHTSDSTFSCFMASLRSRYSIYLQGFPSTQPSLPPPPAVLHLPAFRGTPGWSGRTCSGYISSCHRRLYTLPPPLAPFLALPALGLGGAAGLWAARGGKGGKAGRGRGVSRRRRCSHVMTTSFLRFEGGDLGRATFCCWCNKKEVELEKALNNCVKYHGQQASKRAGSKECVWGPAAGVGDGGGMHHYFSSFSKANKSKATRLSESKQNTLGCPGKKCPYKYLCVYLLLGECSARSACGEEEKTLLAFVERASNRFKSKEKQPFLSPGVMLSSRRIHALLCYHRERGQNERCDPPDTHNKKTKKLDLPSPFFHTINTTVRGCLFPLRFTK